MDSMQPLFSENVKNAFNNIKIDTVHSNGV